MKAELMDEIHRLILRAFKAGAHGSYRPGAVVNIHTDQPPALTTYTEYHERIHERLVSFTSLGSIAYTIGLLKAQRPDLFMEGPFSDLFLNKYIRKTKLAHEGFTIAWGLQLSQNLDGRDFPTEKEIEGIHPADEVKAARLILEKADEITVCFLRIFKTGSIPKVILPDPVPPVLISTLLLEAMGTLVLSPAITLDEAADALTAGNKEAHYIASDIWRRLQRILTADPVDLFGAILKFNSGQIFSDLRHWLDCIKEKSPAASAQLESLRTTLLSIMCEQLQLNYSPPFTPEQILGWHNVEYARMVDVSDDPPPGWLDYTIISAAHEPVAPVLPQDTLERNWRNLFTRNAVSTVQSLRSKSGAIIIAEYVIQPIGMRAEDHNKIITISSFGSKSKLESFGPGYIFQLALYEFSREGEHSDTFIFHDPTITDLRCSPDPARLLHPMPDRRGEPHGMVVSLEDLTASARFRANLVGIDLFVTTKRIVRPDHFHSFDILGTAYGATLCRTNLIEGRVMWSLVAPGLVGEKRPLSAIECAYVWVLRNGIIAREKWALFGTPKEG